MKSAFEAGLAPLKDAQAEIKRAQTDLSEKLAALDEKKASGQDMTDIKGRLAESQKQLETLGTNFVAIQKKMAAQQTESMDVAAQIARADGLKEAITNGKGMEFKDITLASFSQANPLPNGIRAANRGMIMPINQRLFLRDVIPTGNTNLAAIGYLQEAGYTNNTAIVQPGAIKPQSEITFANRLLNMKKMAHSFRVDEEMLDDVDGLEAYLRERGLWGLAIKEEAELLAGDGTADELDGLLMPQNHTAYVGTTVPGVTPTNAMDDIRVAIAQAEAVEIPASAIIMNRLDAAALDLEKDADGKYLHPAFSGNTAWGLPVVRTNGLAQGQFIVGAFVGNAMIWQRKGVEVRKSTEDRDNFIRNKVTILIEERLNLEVLRPEGIVAGTLTVPAAPAG
ncbi:phage major capsid protein [Paracoccus hibiscisoli]|uniref:phage major capsid protein n=1 Tax=Paracoccus hibiscisoli TaxID=2023261 RepID=UPI0023F4003B|nr:phage major capsid protein [Paracoccus hibiscisoli]